MQSGKLARFLLVAAVLILLDIAIISPGLLGLFSRGSPLLMALGAAVVAGSFSYIARQYRGLHDQPAGPPEIELKESMTHEDYVNAFASLPALPEVAAEIGSVRSHLNQFHARKNAVMQTINDKFSTSEMTYHRFHGVTVEVEKLFYANVKSILSKLKLLYSHIAEKGADKRILPPHVVQERERLKHEYIQNIRNYIGLNEEIILKLDRLLLEMIKLETVDLSSVESLTCLQEIDKLIQHTKYYRD